jgi:hypothetical protein
MAEPFVTRCSGTGGRTVRAPRRLPRPAHKCWPAMAG